jgi:ribosomal protein L16 Arg81 hydroxylase
LHCDSANIFAHQIHGNKSWTLLLDYKNGEYTRNQLNKLDISRMPDKKEEYTLTRNEMLYVPNNMPHLAICTNNSSMHLTYAFQEIPVKSTVVNFMILKMKQELLLGNNMFDIKTEGQTESLQQIIDYFKSINANEITREFTRDQLKNKMYILANGRKYN